MRAILVLLLIFANQIAAPSRTSASVVAAVSMTGFGTVYGQNNFTDGWRFSTSVPISVVSLGFWDEGGNGLSTSHPVAIWSDAGTFLTSATVTPSAVLDANNFRYVPITPFTLNPGTYRIGAQMVNQSDPLGARATGFSSAPGITYLGSVESSGSGFNFPNSSFGSFNPGFFGPNFQFDAVPESTHVMLAGACGLLFLGLRLRRAERSATALGSDTCAV